MQRTPPELTAHARALRRDATPAERRLWQVLRTLRPRFTRQLVVSHFILDFACRSCRLAVELDGGQHAANEVRDAARTAYLEAHGWRVLRFWNNDVLENLEAVVAAITAEFAAPSHPPPTPPLQGGE